MLFGLHVTTLDGRKPAILALLARNLFRIFDLAASGQEAEARSQVRLSLQPRQAALSTTVARFLVLNNESEAQTAVQVQQIYANVQRQVRWFTLATLAAITGIGLFLIVSSRRLFGALGSLSDQRRELAQQLIGARESTLKARLETISDRRNDLDLPWERLDKVDALKKSLQKAVSK